MRAAPEHRYAAVDFFTCGEHQALLRSRGYKWLGRSSWSDGKNSRSCEVFYYDLAPLRAAP